MPPLLSQEEIGDRLAGLNGWRQEGRRILQDYAFPSFREAMAFVNRVAEVAEEIDHHPDITISYTGVSLSITTHSEGGLTRRDFHLAGRIDGFEDSPAAIAECPIRDHREGHAVGQGYLPVQVRVPRPIRIIVPWFSRVMIVPTTRAVRRDLRSMGQWPQRDRAGI